MTLYNRFMSHLVCLGVMPPDEYCYNVDNSVYTNAVAKYRYNKSTSGFYTYSKQ